MKPQTLIRYRYKGVRFVVWEDDDTAFYRFRFEIEGKVVEGKVKTVLAGVAAFRARRVISRKLKERSAE